MRTAFGIGLRAIIEDTAQTRLPGSILNGFERNLVKPRRIALRILANCCYPLFVLFCAALPSRAQYDFDVWTADDGLPQNIISGICQTPDGYLWLATYDGVVRFDGVRFVVFNKSNSAGISSNRFELLDEDRNGDLWLRAEDSGLTRYHRGTFTTDAAQYGLPPNSIRGVAGDGLGGRWVLSSQSSILQWQEASRRFIDITPRRNRTTYNSFLWRPQDGFWGVDSNVLYCFVKGRFLTYRLPHWLCGLKVEHVAIEESGTLWLETGDGTLARIRNAVVEHISAREGAITYRDRRGNAWRIGIGKYLVRFMDCSSGGKPERIAFSVLYEDREANIWLATDGRGLYRARRKAITSYSTKDGLGTQNVYPIYQDRTGVIWIGSWIGSLSRFQNGRFTTYTMKDGVPPHPTALSEDSQGRLWVAGDGIRTYEHGRFVEPVGVAPSQREIHALHGDRDGAIWFGTSRGLARFKDGTYTLYTANDGVLDVDVRVIIDDRANGLWIGGYGGLMRFQNGRFTGWTERQGLPSNSVRSLYEDRDGVLWVGTYDGGLGRLKDGKFTHYSEQSGLFNNGVFQILEDARENLWMSCNRGIYRVSKRELNEFAAGKTRTITSIAYGRSDGMLNVECNGGISPAGIKARDGKLWFPTQDGVAVIDPDAIPINPQPPPVMIESVLVDHAPISPDGPLRIGPDKQNFEIQYTALSFINSRQIRFNYKLEGVDSDWVDAGLRRTAYYSHLPPGNYLFRVIARNSDGIWNNEGKSLSITVLAPFYRRWWFELLELMGAAILVGGAWRYRVSQFERAQALQQGFSQQLIASQENERKRIAAELHDSVGQRLVIMKNLALFFMQAQGQAAVSSGKVRAIEEISAEAALAIDETREISYNLRPFHLDSLGLTKAIEAIVQTVSRASATTFFSEIDNIDDVFPEELRINFYRIVQECLNNIVKHAQATEASVRVKRSSDGVTLTIRDNGTGFTRAHGTSESNLEPGTGGFGLIGIAERARSLGGELSLQTAAGRGTVVSVQVNSGGKRHG